MRLLSALILLCLPTYSAAFAPTQHASLSSPLFRQQATLVSEPESLHNLSDNVSSKLESLMEKADDLLLKRAMRFVNHAPIIVTLGTLLKQLESTKFGLDIAPSALNIAAPAGLGSIPTWIGYALPVVVVTQVAAVLRSSLAEDKDELSQEDISATAVSNFALARALQAPTTLNWAIAAVASGYYTRKHGKEDPKMANLSIQITSSLASVATVLGVAAKLPNLIPILQGQEHVTALVGLLGYLGLASREGNGTVKKVVNAAVIGGVLISKIASGALNASNLLRIDTIVTVATAYVAAISIDKARDAIMNDN
ncbi:hypothetical protein IV203_017788 [Nitzschia inconspicua]|uniref:Uncharacterized protein n=1 Tax=Nitzschia inconspicua TaxID=303405 RepID=A0A9K3M0L6_9STRA|nr:hypothetical protein IV203_024878 [Nitzschia inconspicua]KAG7371647.1 hypothetical protein IV203_017788 [Nitzschia inconspicua]